jgi:hypothetical protein
MNNKVPLNAEDAEARREQTGINSFKCFWHELTPLRASALSALKSRSVSLARG